MNTPGKIETASQRVFREDVLLFINGCFAATAQGGFYRSEFEERLSIDFVHDYMLHNYRRVYALTLAAGINDFNAALIVRHLLAQPRVGERHPRENDLITAALRHLPPQRVYRLFKELRKRRVNNRRTRAVIRRFIDERDRWEFDAMKYRRGLSSAVRHARVPLPDEIGAFLFEGKKRKRFESPLLESWRAAHYAQEAMYRLPYTVAEGFAQKHGVDRGTFLKKISPQMTKNERERLQRSAAKHKVDTGADLSRMPLMRLASFVLAMPMRERIARAEELHAAFQAAAATLAGRKTNGTVALVLDDSYSAIGTRGTRHRPLAMAIGVHYLVHASFENVRTHWVHGPTPADGDVRPFFVRPHGQTNIASILLRALENKPDLVFVVSDGWENDPPGATAALLQLYGRLEPKQTMFVHANPVFDSATYEPRRLGAGMATVGVRRPGDLMTCLAYASFALGRHDAGQLEAALEQKAHVFCEVLR